MTSICYILSSEMTCFHCFKVTWSWKRGSSITDCLSSCGEWVWHLLTPFLLLLTTMQQVPRTVSCIFRATLCLHNLMRTPYPSLQNNGVDCDTWNDSLVLTEINRLGGNVKTQEGKQQIMYYTEYYHSPAATVPLQDTMIQFFSVPEFIVDQLINEWVIIDLSQSP